MFFLWSYNITYFYYTPIFITAESGNEKIVEFLLGQKNIELNTKAVFNDIEVNNVSYKMNFIKF